MFAKSWTDRDNLLRPNKTAVGFGENGCPPTQKLAASWQKF
jgi:hypothetical protein